MRGAVEIGLRAAGGKMQDAVELALRQRRRDRRRKVRGLDRAIDHRGMHGQAGGGEIAGAVLAGEIEQRRAGAGLHAQKIRAQKIGAQEIDEIALVAVGGPDIAKAQGAGGLGGAAADGERRQRA